MTEPQPWRVLQSETVLDFSPWLKVIRQAVALPNGVVIPDYVLAPARDFSMVLALTDSDEVLLVRQYKHGLERVVYDFPAGYLDTPDEHPLACAQRELREETGYSAGDWAALGAYALDTNRSRTAAHFFLARALTQSAPPQLDDTEALTHQAVPWRQIPALLQSGGLPSVAAPAIWGLALAHLSGLV